MSSNSVYCCDQNNNCQWKDSCSSTTPTNYTSVIVAGVLLCLLIGIIVVCKLFVCSRKSYQLKEDIILIRKLKELRGEMPGERHGVGWSLSR